MTFAGKLGLIGAFFLGLITLTACAAPPKVDPLAWPAITLQTRPWMWWWWHGSAVDETNITHELQRFRDAGLGGVQITAIFGVKGAEARDIPYLTPRWLAMMGHAVDTANGLGMGASMTLGTGWCFGGPTVSDQDANASVVVKTYQLGVGERIQEKIKRDSVQALVAFWPDGKSIDLTASITTNGEVFFSPPGNWIGNGTNTTPPKVVTIYAISQKPSGQKVKRPAPGDEGWMLNPAYPQAMRDWLGWFDTALAKYDGPKPQALFQDSYEYRTDWSPDFFAQFEKYRGYKLQAELPALFGKENDEHAARVKYDYRRTLSDIMVEQSEPAWIDWAHQNGCAAIYEAHGTPGNWLDLYALADIPETEMFHNDRSILISKFASSAAHTQGRELTGAETGTWLKEHFTETLGDLKQLADDMFLAGVNHIYYHGACYSPDDAPWPGWLFYASTEMNPRNSIWRDAPTLNEYIARCQSFLQSGKPDNDVLLYWPVADFWSEPAGRVQPMGVSETNWFTDQRIGKTAHELWDRGYAFDYISDRQLLAAQVKGGAIQMPGGNYKVIVVPECKFIPLETFKQLLVLAKDGATVIFQNELPADVSGWHDLKEQQKEFRRQRDKLQDAFKKYVSGKNFGKGAILCGELDLSLWKILLPRETLADDGLSFIRRSFDGGWNYFIVNRGTNNFDGWITLARPKKFTAVILDPVTGSSGMAAQNADSQIRLQLANGEALILRAFQDEQIAGPAWNYWQTNGQPLEITGQWKVKFIQGGPTLPADFETTKPASWTTFPDTNAQSFAGSASYSIMFDAPSGKNTNYLLDLGDVRQSARVRVNGKDYGTLIVPPFRVVVDNLKPAGNTLEVEVTSVSANRIRDLDRRGVTWKIFKDINIVNVNYRPFDASNWPLTDCGLLGPVTLTALQPQANLAHN
ncbi:MAG TPA: glycosyl hydrolase [Verrucomicrobiae bacterium]|nr:glycosyl hydrolase [Verrucomicrobiae bacterium]